MSERPKINFDWNEKNFRVITTIDEKESKKSYKGIYNAAIDMHTGRNRLTREVVSTTVVGLSSFGCGLLLFVNTALVDRNLENLKTATLFAGGGVGMVFTGYLLHRKRDFVDWKINNLEIFRKQGLQDHREHIKGLIEQNKKLGI